MPIMTKNGPYNQTREEMEVHISFNAKDDGAVIHSTYPTYNRKLDKLCAQYPQHYRRLPDPHGVDDDWRKYAVSDWGLISLRGPVSQARREAARKNAATLTARHESQG